MVTPNFKFPTYSLHKFAIRTLSMFNQSSIQFSDIIWSGILILFWRKKQEILFLNNFDECFGAVCWKQKKTGKELLCTGNGMIRYIVLFLPLCECKRVKGYMNSDNK